MGNGSSQESLTSRTLFLECCVDGCNSVGKSEYRKWGRKEEGDNRRKVKLDIKNI